MKRVLALGALVVTLWTPSYAQTGPSTITLNPVMTKGPARATVTIVEFSDYQ